MRLKSRFVIIVNVVILTTMTVFFIVDDRRLRTSHIEATVQGTNTGMLARGIAEKVAMDVQNLVHPTERLARVQQELQAMANDPELKRVLDIRVTISLDNPKVIASLTSDAERRLIRTGQDTFLSISPEEYAQLEGILDSYGLGETSGIVSQMMDHEGVWATRLLIPYTWDVTIPEDEPDAYYGSIGLIEILIDSSEVPAYWRDFRLIHLLFVVLLAITLTVFIDLTTDRMVLRPLERLTDIIRRAERGVVRTDADFPTNEVGRVSSSLTEMLATMQRLHSERLAALERLASGVAHEIRNPLHAISMSAQYLKDLLEKSRIEPDQRADAEEVLEMVTTEVRELNRIASQFMNLTRPVEMEWTLENVNLTLDNVIAEFSLLLTESNVEVRREYDEALKPVALDVVRIRSAFYNLIQNAIQAMPNGGAIYLKTSAQPRGATVEIRDTGPGISKKVVQQIFDPYFTTRDREGGMGLGLTLTKNAIDAHNGRIDVRTKPGAGAAFRIRLPYRADTGQSIEGTG